MRLLITHRAEKHLHSTAAYIAQDNQDAALMVLDALEKIFEMLLEHPELGTAMLESGLRKFNMRKFNMPKLPFIIIYQEHADCIEILSVFHTSRPWQELM